MWHHERASPVALMNVLTFVQRGPRLKWTACSSRAGVFSEWAIPDDDILDGLERGRTVLSCFFRTKSREIVSDPPFNQLLDLVLGLGGRRIRALLLDLGLFLGRVFGILWDGDLTRSAEPDDVEFVSDFCLHAKGSSSSASSWRARNGGSGRRQWSRL
jgi:hypothetical protein